MAKFGTDSPAQDKAEGIADSPAEDKAEGNFNNKFGAKKKQSKQGAIARRMQAMQKGGN